jgi:hypothetical protein
VRLVIINTTPILGIYALETLGLKPNPVTGKLEVIGPEGGYLLQLTYRHVIESSAEEIISTFMRSEKRIVSEDDNLSDHLYIQWI